MPFCFSLSFADAATAVVVDLAGIGETMVGMSTLSFWNKDRFATSTRLN